MKFEKEFDGQKDSKLGTPKNPAVVSVQNKTRKKEVEKIFKEHGWAYTITVDSKQPENIVDLEMLQNPPKTLHAKDKIGRNDPCSCGSGKKYKHCCGK